MLDIFTQFVFSFKSIFINAVILLIAHYYWTPILYVATVIYLILLISAYIVARKKKGRKLGLLLWLESLYIAISGISGMIYFTIQHVPIA